MMEDPDAGEANPFGGGPVKRVNPRAGPLSDLFKEVGIDFPPGATVEYDEERAELRALNSSANLDLIDRLFESCAFDLSRERALGRK